MADLALVEADVRLTHPRNSIVFDGIAAEALTIGQILYQTSAGKMGIADANVGGKQQARGLALNTTPIGGAVSFLVEGPVAGFTLAGNHDTAVYMSDTAGKAADAAGTLSVILGRIMAVPDAALTKLIYFKFDWLRAWA